MEFRDQCVITRANGGKDGWDNDMNAETIYAGSCMYQEGGAGYTRIFTTRNPTVFLPVIGEQVKINDAIEVTTEFGRTIKSIVKIVRDVNLHWRGNIKVTRIELKQAQGD